MPRLKLTEKTIAKMKAPDPSGKQVLHWDTELRGFAVLCSGVSNSRTYIAQRDMPNGRTRRVTVGAVNEIALAEARERAADMLDDLRRGLDPKHKVVNATLRSAFSDYLTARKDLRPASIKAYRVGIERHLAQWLDWPLREITSEMVEERHRAIATEIGRGERYKGTTTANGTMRALRLVWNFAADRIPDLPPNPVRRLRRQWYAEPRRERMVRAEELPKFYEAVCALPSPVARDFLLLVLFTGLRLHEASSLTWEDVDLTLRVIRVTAARTKGKRKLDLPMTDFVRDMLVARRAIGVAAFVFPAPGKAGHIVDPSFSLGMVAKASGIKVSAHDLRRTFMTVAESADISPLALKALVNHTLGGGVTEGYVQMTVERLREPAQRVCDKLKALCGVTAPEGENVAMLKS
ncbi:MAG TPA: tyrosine-type recombinase/integrase [Pseudolabrys sp.]|jgi:integrase